MAFKYTNKHEIPLPLAVFLMRDKYGYDGRPNVISATKLIRPLRELTLIRQNPEKSKTVDVSELIALRMGSAIHSACEEAWTDRNNVVKALELFGAADSVIDKLRLNPENPMPGETPVYIEQRTEKEINDFIITGAYDLILDGEVNDYKSASVWSFINGSSIDDYIKQGSIYKWLNPEKITSDHVHIHYIFTDWSRNGLRKHSPKPHYKEIYPAIKVASRRYPLWSIEETEKWITDRLEQFKSICDLSQSELPECTNEELWVKEHESVYKYYKNPEKTKRSSGNFPTMDEALKKQASEGSVGIIKHVQGPVRRCNYCSAEEICHQAANLLTAGRLAV
tara:strand:+ start:684 stop:1694 length:1011 start_codon:yes stop_codon:yes gene_type:complete